MSKKNVISTEPDHIENKVIIAGIVIIVLIVLAWISYTSFYQNKSTGGVDSTLQQCINSKGLTIFFLPSCPHCQAMEKELANYTGIQWIDCSVELTVCNNLDITGVPAYGISAGGTFGMMGSAGEKSISDLKNMLNC